MKMREKVIMKRYKVPEGQTHPIVMSATPGRGYLCAQGWDFRSVARCDCTAGRKVETCSYMVADRRIDGQKDVGRKVRVAALA